MEINKISMINDFVLFVVAGHMSDRRYSMCPCSGPCTVQHISTAAIHKQRSTYSLFQAILTIQFIKESNPQYGISWGHWKSTDMNFSDDKLLH